ncbi:hypothetical protein ACJ3XI_07745 [Litorimonas sp. RW-G-Af-16]|uniref:hypothetical protein n=1 Tax=Litorimonas sp. RW-G-Af-16 TaxID=3241168 RepID=UPI00390C478F
MILDLINIFKARRDPVLAAKLGGQFATEQALDKFSWPLIIVKFWLGLAGLICAALIIMFIYAAYKLGWAAALPAFIPAAVIYLIVKIWRGINTGLERVKAVAQSYTNRSVDTVSAKLHQIRAAKADNGPAQNPPS